MNTFLSSSSQLVHLDNSELKKKKFAIRQELHRQRVIVNEYESNVNSVGYISHDEEAQRREEFIWYQEQYEIMQQVNFFLFDNFLNFSCNCVCIN